MKTTLKIIDQVLSQKLACRFNEDESVWRRYELRRLRRRLGSGSLLPDDVLDELDWIEAEREACGDIWCPPLRVNNPHADTPQRELAAR